jgi:hypothetical protein
MAHCSGGTLASGDRTALIIAARGGDEETVRRLIQCGVNVNAGGTRVLSIRRHGNHNFYFKVVRVRQLSKPHLRGETPRL